ncbi:AraC family transcriptional regulator [Catellatospora vulcania]|uniref:AraC family transcriptional regulator n=1 Tax=Catellatospora vulcania TaxID=1460450 RepID=UPI0018AF7AA7|nr:AraC family transcriptional regulator [Catellatospora vulcania]
MRIRTREFTTGDVEVAHHALRETYVEHRHRVFGGAQDFQFRQHVVTAGELGMDSVRHTATVETVTDPLPYLMFVVSLNADLTVRAGRDELRPMRGEAFLYPVGMPLTIRWTDFDLRLLRVPAERVARVAARAGVALADFRFDGMSPVSAEAGRHWRDTMAYLFHMLNAPDTPLANPLVHASAIDLAATTAIATFPNTATTSGYVGEPGRVAPAALRRAVAFVDAHAHEPVTVEDIAEAAGISSRGLQAAFARHADSTPMAYLRRVRLARAHRDLQNADPTRGDTVAAVARRWGFTSLSRFAAVYREEYGRSPRQTLRT